ncbi:MAG: PSP1 domain-containing protein [Desulfocapsaceae bacterium]
MSEQSAEQNSKPEEPEFHFYRMRFRHDGQEFTATAKMPNLKRDEMVMVKTDHGLEPAVVYGFAPPNPQCEVDRRASFEISRRPTSDEENRYKKLAAHEDSAFEICQKLIDKHELIMRLIRVEKFFNGSKMIFYFTADSRVDFRALVKDLVQEFRTRVEMRQVGVRHETKMIGGVGVCGRELCCSSFMKKFDSVSIKMAKEQDLPLNPTKISGVCNRLLCCLTYEYDNYRNQRKKMPRVGRRLKIEGEIFRVKRQIPLQQAIVVSGSDGEEKLLLEHDWTAAEILKAEKAPRKNDKKGAGSSADKPEKKA